MPRKEREPRREPDAKELYYKAASYASDQSAYAAYSQLESKIFKAQCDLSTYRIRFANVPHVVVLGEQAPEDLHQDIEAILANGGGSALPAAVVNTLVQRRTQAKRVGSWIEGHYRSGKTM